LLLSGLQFAEATVFHFIFVPLCHALAVLVAIMDTMYVRSGDEKHKRMGKLRELGVKSSLKTQFRRPKSY
jgi:cytochrome d ubiquinol oxidase subunit I